MDGAWYPVTASNMRVLVIWTLMVVVGLGSHESGRVWIMLYRLLNQATGSKAHFGSFILIFVE